MSESTVEILQIHHGKNEANELRRGEINFLLQVLKLQIHQQQQQHVHQQAQLQEIVAPQLVMQLYTKEFELSCQGH